MVLWRGIQNYDGDFGGTVMGCMGFLTRQRRYIRQRDWNIRLRIHKEFHHGWSTIQHAGWMVTAEKAEGMMMLLSIQSFSCALISYTFCPKQCKNTPRIFS